MMDNISWKQKASRFSSHANLNELKRAVNVFGILFIYWIIAIAFLYRDDIAYALHATIGSYYGWLDLILVSGQFASA